MLHYLRHHLRHTATTLAWPAAVTVGLGLAGSAMAVAPALASTGGSGQPGYVVQQILSGQKLHHSYTAAGKVHTEPLADPDDLTSLGPVLFTAFQNGVGPQGQAATDANTDSTVVEFTADGQPVRQWDIVGKCDGVTADPITHQLIATVNEDAHSSVYTIAPWAPAGHQVRHYQYNEPLPSKGGTDAISIYHGMVLISASAPGTTGAAAPQPGYPAVYQVTFDPASLVATVHPLFYDESTATVANNGSGHPRVKLALTDPDSNEVVPWSAPRFAGDFMLTSQGDKEQIYVQQAGQPGQQLLVLKLGQSVDDTAWATSHYGRLYAADTSGDTIDLVTGSFTPGTVFVAVTPCDANGAPATCPGPGYPANYLGTLNPSTGQITAVPLHGPALEPQGLLFAGS